MYVHFFSLPAFNFNCSIFPPSIVYKLNSIFTTIKHIFIYGCMQTTDTIMPDDQLNNFSFPKDIPNHRISFSFPLQIVQKVLQYILCSVTNDVKQ